MLVNRNTFCLLSIFSLSACGTIPVPHVAGNDDPKPEVMVTSETMNPSLEDDAAKATELASVSGAESLLRNDDFDRPLLDSPRAYWRKAIGYLQNGDEEGARWALDQALAMRPNYKRANDLLAQLNVDPQQELGKKSYEYRLQYGDSLSKLAAAHLNDPLKFYLLARYNNIENPGRIKVGQKVRIPGHQQQEITIEQDLAVSDTSYIKAKSYFDIGKYDDTISLLEGSLDEMGLTDDELRAINKLLTNAFIQKALKLEQQNKILAAKKTLMRAIDLQPGNSDIRFHLESLNTQVELDQYYQQAQTAASEGQVEEAFIAFDKVLEIDPEHRQAKEQRDKLYIEVSDKLYKRALLAQRRQNLPRAIDLWDQFLEMMPENENAKLFRAKAVRMQASLQRFASQQ